jgi:hypothetical protein
VKSLIWLGLFVGSTIGSLIPLLWGGSELSMSSVIFGAIGGLLGIWAGFRISQ